MNSITSLLAAWALVSWLSWCETTTTTVSIWPQTDVNWEIAKIISLEGSRIELSNWCILDASQAYISPECD